MQKITYMGTQVYPKVRRDRKGRYSFKSRIAYQYHRVMAWLWKWTKRVAIVALTLGFLFGAYFLGTVNAKEITAVNHITVVQPNEIAPILHKIALAESGGHQFDANGLPLMHANSNGSVDIGILQINNRVWGKKAKELGYNLLTEDGNMKMGTWILENRGTDAWNSSSNAWK